MQLKRKAKLPTVIGSIPDLCTFTYFKSLLRQGLSEPDFYGDLVYKLKKIVGSNDFSSQFIKIISHYKKIGYNINVLQQTAITITKKRLWYQRHWLSSDGALKGIFERIRMP